jgi:ornithine decarboxylase
MTLNRKMSEFIDEKEFKFVKEWTKDKQTPLLAINLERIRKRYNELIYHMPYAKVYYAVKANPNREVLMLLHEMGSFFDIASVYELDYLISLGISPAKMSYGNTIKKEKDIAYAYEKGIRLFATDSHNDLERIANHAPGSSVFFRIIMESSSADWPLSRKFGAHPDLIYDLVLKSVQWGIDPYGISFHVGSQQRDIGQWDNAIAQVKYLFDGLNEQGIRMRMINLGGGFPANYLKATQGIGVYAREITRFLADDFGDDFPEIFIEPGRSLVADAGILISEVVLIANKSRFNQYSWVYLDTGKFGGLIETLDEAIKYPIFKDFNPSDNESMEVILAGPTCDSADVLYEDFKYIMPKDLKEGDRIYILTTGAYTTSYSSVNFNGFPPLKEETYSFRPGGTLANSEEPLVKKKSAKKKVIKAKSKTKPKTKKSVKRAKSKLR